MAQVAYLKEGYAYLEEKWIDLKPSKVTLAEKNKFDFVMSKHASGHHYEEFINLFRRIKVRNNISPYGDDNLVYKELLVEFVREIRITTEEQALGNPPTKVHKWPDELKNDPKGPDSIFNLNQPNDLWLQLDPVGQGENT